MARAVGSKGINMDGFATYYPEMLDRPRANALYRSTRAILAEHGKQHTVKVFGKDFPVPRLVCAVASSDVRDYAFSGNVLRAAATWEEVPDLNTLRKEVGELLHLEHELNFALLNFYSDGAMKIGKHCDSEDSVLPGTPIVSVTLCNGAGRDFWVWDPHTNKKHILLLKHGDVLVFDKTVPHELPKRARADPRVNITFRCHKGSD